MRRIHLNMNFEEMTCLMDRACDEIWHLLGDSREATEQRFSRLDSLLFMQEKLGYTFQKISLLFTALLHRSFINEAQKDWSSNERLEFLGDALLNSFVARKLFHKFPDFSEGELSSLRGALVNQERLAELALHLGLEKCTLVGKGQGKCISQRLLASSFEALVGAISLDSGREDEVISAFMESVDPGFFSDKWLGDFDPKGRLQEFTLQKWGVLPEYRFKTKNLAFEVELVIQGKSINTMVGPSKKAVEKMLAQKYMKEISPCS